MLGAKQNARDSFDRAAYGSSFMPCFTLRCCLRRTNSGPSSSMIHVTAEMYLIAEVTTPLGLIGAVPLSDAVLTSPVIADGRIYVVDGSGVVFCIDRKSLSVVWKRETRGGAANCNNISSPAIVRTLSPCRHYCRLLLRARSSNRASGQGDRLPRSDLQHTGCRGRSCVLRHTWFAESMPSRPMATWPGHGTS